MTNALVEVEKNINSAAVDNCLLVACRLIRGFLDLLPCLI